MFDHRREQLIDQLEEATMALLMDEYAELNGARLLQEFEEAEARGETAEVPPELDAACQEWIQKSFAKQRRKTWIQRAARTAVSAAASLLLVIGVASVTIMSVDALRVPVLNYIYQHTEVSTDLVFGDSEEQVQLASDEYVAIMDKLVPEGYELTVQSDDESGNAILVYQKTEDQIITLSVEVAKGRVSFDSEDSLVQHIQLQEHEAFFVEKDGFQLVWVDIEMTQVYSLYANNLEKELFLEIANALA